VIQRVDTNVQLVVHLLPAPRPYTIEWTGAVRAARAGDYVFGTTSVDASAVWVDGSQIVDNRTLNTYQEGSIRLSEGWHDIRVRFLDATTFTHVTLYWQPPGEGRTPVPTEALRPWPADRVQAAEPRISVFGGLIAGDIPQAQAGTSRQLAGADVLSQPRGVAVGLDGTVYVADAGRKAIVAVPLAGEPRLLAEGQLREPSAVAVGRDRAIYALDAAGGLLRIEANGTTGEPVPSDQSFFGPRGLAVAPDGRVAVADTGNNRIVLLSPAGGPSQVVGGVREPTDVAFLPDGNLLIAETGAQQVAVLKLDGQRDGTWPMPRAYTVVGPHVAVLPRGGWVVTAPEERALLRMASGGREPQAVALDANWRKPVGVAVGPAGVVVADAEGARVVLVGLP
jgi:DNA-binding beta-propeller fold protein YncE